MTPGAKNSQKKERRKANRSPDKSLAGVPTSKNPRKKKEGIKRTPEKKNFHG